MNERSRQNGTVSGSPEARRTSAGADILLAEDDPDLLLLIEFSLARSGYRVISALNGEMALKILGKNPGPVSLLLTDVEMPEMNGPTLARRLLGMSPGVKVLFISGDFTKLPDQEEWRADGARFLDKPFQMKDLLEVLTELLPR